MRLLRPLIVTFLGLLFASSAMSHLIPFAFLKTVSSSALILDWDFTVLTSLPSQLTFTRSSTATYFNSSGVMQTASSNTPRFDYDMTTLAAKGLLMEASATNMLAASSNLSGVYWDDGGTGPSVSLDSVVAPDGTTSGDRVTASGDDYFYPIPIPSTTISVNYTFSFYAKSPSPGTLTVVMQEVGGSYGYYAQSTFNITSSWQRFSITAAKNTTNPMRPVIAMYVSSFGNTTVVDYWGAQMELGSYPTSYIPTTNGAVTRAADSATFNTMSWFNAVSGTLFAEYTNHGAESAATYRAFGVYNTNVAGTFAQNAIEIADSGTTGAIKVVTANSTVFNPAGSLNAANTINRQAMTYQANNFTSSVNRGTVTTDTSGTLPAPAYGYVGSAPDGNIRNRHIRKIKYYNYPLSDAALIGL
ncbi:hypothetical protein [Bdellovibrio sp. HCB337]|uniref:phage head spike fiber domain-containing protein n=1 Tax=Bdellovibrio sp. HCB337 TaxID=3394358 RepID=UPI0039A46BEB